MSSYDPIAYTYDADHHCPSCAESRFGLNSDGFISGEDSEGNEVGIVSPWDEWWQADDECEVLACGTCGEEIDRVHGFVCTYSDVDLCDSDGRGEALASLFALGLTADDTFDVAQGLHWWLSENHGGQSQPTYRALCQLDYHQSPLENGPADLGRVVYDALEAGDVDPWACLFFVETLHVSV